MIHSSADSALSCLPALPEHCVRGSWQQRITVHCPGISEHALGYGRFSLSPRLGNQIHDPVFDFLHFLRKFRGKTVDDHIANEVRLSSNMTIQMTESRINHNAGAAGRALAVAGAGFLILFPFP